MSDAKIPHEQNLSNDRRKSDPISDAMYRITKGPANYHQNILSIKNVHIARFETLEEARDMADLINRAILS